MKKNCIICGKEFNGRKEYKCCSKECGEKLHSITMQKRKQERYNSMPVKYCEFCGKQLEPWQNRFCNTSCSAKWRNSYYGPVKMSEKRKKQNAEFMRALWERPEFREQNYKRMTENNPVHQQGVTEKIKHTILKRGGYKNYFKYGNGKMSVYEQIVWETLSELGFEYNKAISTQDLRMKYPEKHIGSNYKPDFLHREKKLCIEVDGPNHLAKSIQEIDKKKDWCLSQLGYTVIRFTHKDIDNGKLGEYLKEWQS